MDRKIRKKFLNALLVSLISCVSVILIVFFLGELYDSFETKTFDFRFRLRPPLPQRSDIVFLEMDQQAIEALGRWPWPREVFARILEALSDFKPKAVLFDVTFTEPAQPIVDRQRLNDTLKLSENKKSIDDFISDAQAMLKEGSIGGQEMDSVLTQLKYGIDTWEENINGALNQALQDNDKVFAEAISKAGNVYLGYHFEVIHSSYDIKRDAAYNALKRGLDVWIDNNPDGNLKAAPPNLKNSPGLSQQEIRSIFVRERLLYLLKKNLSLKLTDALTALGESNAGIVRHNYNDIKIQVLRQKVEDILNERNDLSFKEAIWEMGLFDSQDVGLAKEQYEDYMLYQAFSRKAGIPYALDSSLLKGIKVSPPILIFTQNMRSAGYLNAIADPDGTLRRVPLLVRYKDRVYPHIALRVILDLLKVDPERDLNISPGKFIAAGKKHIPIDKQGYLLVNWADNWQDSFRHISAVQVYGYWQLKQNLSSNLKLPEAQMQEEKLKNMLAQDKERLEQLSLQLHKALADKICIIGLTAPGTHDYTPVPLEADYPAVGTHANVLNTILQEKYLYRIEPKVNALIILAMALLTAACAAFFLPVYGLVSAFLIIALYFFLGTLLFIHRGLWIDMVGPCAASVLSYAGITSYNFAFEEREKKWIKKAFGHYISKNVMEEVLKDPAKLKLGGERKELTVLFADVRGFTGYSEKRQPEEVVAILNEYLDEMTKIVFKYNGTLDKYVGDAIMVIFGAPATGKELNHAGQAVIVAQEMIEHLGLLQEKWISQGREPLDIGIGINTGQMVVGNMGSSERMDYTVIGDAVNLAARIEALTRTYNNHIMISEYTFAYVKDIVQAKPLEAIKVKGKDKPVVMYEVLSVNKEAYANAKT